MVPWLGEPFAGQYNALNLNELPLNFAYVVANTSLQNAAVYTVGDDCYDCPYKLLQVLHPDKEMSWQIDTSVQQTWRIMKNNQQRYLARKFKKGLLCEMRPGLGEFAVYQLEIGLCGLDAEVPPVNSYLPLMFCGLVFLAMLLIYITVKCISSCRQKALEIKNGRPMQVKEEKQNKQTMESLYVLRGLMISFLIFLTNGAGGYSLFTNTWGELTLADSIFFIYAWTMGFRLPTRLSQEKSKGYSKRKIFLGIVKRAVILVVMGSALDSIVYISDSTPAFQTIWWPLQRLGTAYLFAALLYLFTAKNFEFKSKKFIPKIISNVITLKWCLTVSGFVFASIGILIMTALSINCQGNANLDDHIAEFSDSITDVTLNCNSNMTELFNQIIMGRSRGVFSINGYYGFSSGLLGMLTTVALTITGLTAGTVYLNEQSNKVRLQLWTFWATMSGVCGVTIAGLWFPLQLNLWPVAFIFILSSLATYIFAVTYIFVEKEQSTCPVLSPAGITSIALLSSHLLLSSTIPSNWEKKFSNHLFYLMHSIGFVLLWITIAIILRKKNVKFSV